jgi:hypothetical protein
MDQANESITAAEVDAIVKARKNAQQSSDWLIANAAQTDSYESVDELAVATDGQGQSSITS